MLCQLKLRWRFCEDAGGLSVDFDALLLIHLAVNETITLPTAIKELSPTYLCVTIVRIPHQTTVPKRNSIPENTLKTCTFRQEAANEFRDSIPQASFSDTPQQPAGRIFFAIFGPAGGCDYLSTVAF